jgi:3-oxo-5-alpha-steroid 4-dehydrogenase 1
MEVNIYNSLLIGWFLLAAVVFMALFFVAAPYGRHVRRGWGTSIGSKTGWVLMEAPAPLVFAACFLSGGIAVNAPALAFLGLWEAHYLHRAFVYPLGRRDSVLRMPLAVVGMGIFFNILNGYLNGRYLFHFSGGYPVGWLADPRFLAGAALFLAGFTINRGADRTLRELRQPGDETYHIAYRGFYRWVSCPNYLGEIIIWIGWALATWSLAGLAFAFWTLANLLPRARAHHAWYRRHFPDYPPDRKALLPGIW